MDVEFTIVEVDGESRIMEVDVEFTIVEVDGELTIVEVDGEFTIVDGEFTIVEVDGEFTIVDVDGEFTIVEVDGEFRILEVDRELRILEVDREFRILEVDKEFRILEVDGELIFSCTSPSFGSGHFLSWSFIRIVEVDGEIIFPCASPTFCSKHCISWSFGVVEVDGDEVRGDEGFPVFVLAVEFIAFVVSATTSISCVLSDSEQLCFSTLTGVGEKEFSTDFLPDSFKESVAGGSAVVCSSFLFSVLASFWAACVFLLALVSIGATSELPFGREPPSLFLGSKFRERN